MIERKKAKKENMIDTNTKNETKQKETKTRKKNKKERKK